MIRRPPRSTRTDTLFPYTTRCRSAARRDERRLGELEGEVGCGQAVALERVLHEIREGGGGELACRDVHRHGGWGPVAQVLAPGDELAARVVEHPGADRNDEAGLIRYGRSEERRVGTECVSTGSYRRPPYI